MTATAEPTRTAAPIFDDLIEEQVGAPAAPDWKISAYKDPNFFAEDKKIEYPTVADIEHDIDAGITALLEPGAYVAEIEPIVDAQLAARTDGYDEPDTEVFAPVEAPGTTTVTVNMADLLAEDEEPEA